MTDGCLIVLPYRARCILPASSYRKEISLGGDSSKDNTHVLV